MPRTSNFRRQSELGYAFAERVANEAGGFLEVELLHDPRAMRLGGLDVETEEGRDFSGFLTLGEKLEDLPLTRAQRAIVRVPALQIGLDDHTGEPWMEVGPSGHHRVDRLDQFPSFIRLEHAPPETRPQPFEVMPFVRVHGEQDHPGKRCDLTDLTRRVDPVQKRHGPVEDHDVGVQLAHKAHRLNAVGSLADDLEPLYLEENLYAASDYRMIVRQHNPNRHSWNLAYSRKQEPCPKTEGTCFADQGLVPGNNLRKILLVEDDPDIQDVTTVLLGHVENFDVRACGTAAEALETAKSFDPDLILLDVMMPGLDGQGAYAAFRQMPATKSTPVIFMTARVQPREITEYRELGSLGVIPKPFDPDTLARTIQGMWDRHQKDRLNETRREDLASLRRTYAAELPERLRAIEVATAALRDRGWDTRIATDLQEMAHRLAGSAAIYGFPEISEAASRVGAFCLEPAATKAAADPRPFLKAAVMLTAALRQATSQPSGASPLEGR